jgi:hypothetical protein
MSTTGCSHESHAKAKAEHADTLEFHGIQFDEDGEIALVYFDCTLCGSTLSERGPTMAPPGASSGPTDSPSDSAPNDNQSGAPARHEGWVGVPSVIERAA